MYVNVGGGSSGDNSCPSVADSSAVSLAQMAFLSMTVSIFTVVATVANNLNNNNNNNNENNLNFVQQKQNNLQMNQNIVNQINVDLPPPVPGKRSISDVNMEKRVKEVLEARIRQYDMCQDNKDLTPEAAEAVLNILRGMLREHETKAKSSSIGSPTLDTPGSRECLARELCLRSLWSHKEDKVLTPVQTALYQLQSFALLYVQLDDHSLNFGNFLDKVTDAEGNFKTARDCFAMFPYCGIDVYSYQDVSM